MFRVAVPMETNAPDHRPIEELTDTELLDQYRYVAAEFAEETEFNRDGDNGPVAVLEDELKRRGLPHPTQSSLVSPGREKTDPEREKA